MKFLKTLTQKNLAKAVVCGLVLSGGMLVGMGQACAEPVAPTTYISGAEYNDAYGSWVGTGTEVKVSAESGDKNYSEYKRHVRGSVGKDKSGKVIITGGNLHDEHSDINVYGGGDVDGPVMEGYTGNNTVIVSGGDIDAVFGGYVGAKEGNNTTEGNTVTISGGTIGNVYSGYINGNNGSASNNTVTISGGHIDYNVHGAYVSGSGSASNNTVTISGGSIGGYVVGGYATGSASNNTVNLIGNDGKLGDIAGKGEITITGIIYGGYSKTESTGNTLNVAGNKISAKGIEYFQNMNFYVPKTSVNGAAMLTVNNSVDLGKVESIRAIAGKGANVEEGDKITFIDAKIDGFDSAKTSGKLEANDFQYYDMTYVGDENGLVGKIASPAKFENIENAKSPVETQAASMTMLTIGADMLASQGFANAASAVAGEVNAGGSASSMTPFMAVGGNKSKVKSGSHVDVKGWNLNVGLAKEIDNKAGKLLFGPIVEYGRGSYDSYLDNGFHGEGDSKYMGIGMMAKQTNDNGFYYEGSLRVGKLDNDYKAGQNRYDSDSAYYAAHVGIGKIVKLSEKNSLNYYGKYFYTHQKGDDTTMETWGTDVALHLDSVDSNRTKIGSRFTHALSDKDSIYVGLAWQHEFSGTARATMNGLSTPAPSIKGNTGLMELGWKVKADKNLDLDLGATAYTGKQKGASLNLAMNFKF